MNLLSRINGPRNGPCTKNLAPRDEAPSRLLLARKNVRELANVIEYASKPSPAGRTILPEDLPEELKRPAMQSKSMGRQDSLGQCHRTRSIKPAVNPDEDLEAARLRSILDAYQWKRAESRREVSVSVARTPLAAHEENCTWHNRSKHFVSIVSRLVATNRCSGVESLFSKLNKKDSLPFGMRVLFLR